MDAGQGFAVRGLLNLLVPSEVHIGDCVGADRDFYLIACMHQTRPRLIGHPPSDDKWRTRSLYDEERQPKPYLQRNKDIVDECDVLLATPDRKEYQRSGTWATIRYARKQGKRIYIVYPWGTEVEEGE